MVFFCFFVFFFWGGEPLQSAWLKNIRFFYNSPYHLDCWQQMSSSSWLGRGLMIYWRRFWGDYLLRTTCHVDNDAKVPLEKTECIESLVWTTELPFIPDNCNFLHAWNFIYTKNILFFMLCRIFKIMWVQSQLFRQSVKLQQMCIILHNEFD